MVRSEERPACSRSSACPFSVRHRSSPPLGDRADGLSRASGLPAARRSASGNCAGRAPEKALPRSCCPGSLPSSRPGRTTPRPATAPQRIPSSPASGVRDRGVDRLSRNPVGSRQLVRCRPVRTQPVRRPRPRRRADPCHRPSPQIAAILAPRPRNLRPHRRRSQRPVQDRDRRGPAPPPGHLLDLADRGGHGRLRKDRRPRRGDPCRPRTAGSAKNFTPGSRPLRQGSLERRITPEPPTEAA